MTQAMSEIKQTLTHILNKLQTVSSQLVRQEEDMKEYLARRGHDLGSDELIIAVIKSTKTSFELLRDEVEELHEVTITLFNKKGNAIKEELEE